MRVSFNITSLADPITRVCKQLIGPLFHLIIVLNGRSEHAEPKFFDGISVKFLV